MAGGGATFADYDSATHAHGLASTGPIISMVGVGGYTLDGGIGWLHRKLGLACDMADEGARRITDAYSPHTFQRLTAIKAMYDPDNRFRMNQNIRPMSPQPLTEERHDPGC